MYHNNTLINVEDPTIHRKVKLGSLPQWQTEIEKLRQSQPVLVYAKGDEYKKLCALEFVLPVTDETATTQLENM